MKGALVKVAILSFFPQDGLYFQHAKNQPPLKPLSTFSEHWPWFWQYLLSKNVTKKFGTKFGSWSSQKVQNFLFGGLYEWEISVYFGPLFVLVKTLLGALTYSAMRSSPLFFILPSFCFLLLLISVRLFSISFYSPQPGAPQWGVSLFFLFVIILFKK